MIARVTVPIVVLIASIDSASAQGGGWNTLTVCNDGNTTVRVAMARQVRGFFSNGRRLSGWWVIEPEDCERIFAFDSSESLNAYFTFLYRDRQNREGVVQIGRPGDDRMYETSDDTFCVPMGDGDFKTETDVHHTCPSHYAPPDFQTVTFPLFFKAGALDDSEGANDQRLHVAADANRASDGLILRWGPTAESSSASIKPPAAPSASASEPALPIGKGPLTFVSAERVEVVNRPQQGSGWWGLDVPPHTEPTLKASGGTSFVVVTYRVPVTSTALWYLPASFVSMIGSAQNVAIRAEGHSTSGTLKVVFEVPRSVHTFPVRYNNGSPVQVSMPWWTSLVGTWRGSVVVGFVRKPLTLEVKSANGALSALLRNDEDPRFTWNLKGRVVDGSNAAVVISGEPGAELHGQLSSDGQRLEGQLDVAIWSKTPVVFTRQ